MKLQKKYFLIFFTLFVVLSLAMSVTTYILSNHILLGKYEEMSSDSLSYLLEITEKEMDQLSSTFAFIANDPTVYERITGEFDESNNYGKLSQDNTVTDMFDAMSSFEIFKEINYIYIKGINGEEYWYGAGADFVKNDPFIESLNINESANSGKLVYHDVIDNRNPYSQSNHVLRFTKSLSDGFGHKIGIIYFELGAEYFKQLYDNQELEFDTRLYLTDSQGQIIYNSDNYMVGRALSSLEVTGVVVDQTMDNYSWHLISEASESQIYAESGMIFRVTIIMAVVSIVFAMILIMAITSRIVQPIKQLTKALKKVQAGDLSQQVYHISHDEIGDLTKNFNDMTLQLKGNMDKEISYNKAINDAEYKALQAQINPHFMYNALNALKWLAGIQKADNIIELVDSLWTLLRRTSSLKGQSVTLGDEIEVIQAYCSIQQVRYKGKFEVVYEISEELLLAHIPKYILQPFVENAIFHGIEPKRGTGTIVVRALTDKKDLVISVEDDGVGMPTSRIKKLLVDDSSAQQYGSGLNNIGVKNIKERLVLLYGPDYGIDIDSREGVGTTMMIRIPLKGTGDEGLLKKIEE